MLRLRQQRAACVYGRQPRHPQSLRGSSCLDVGLKIQGQDNDIGRPWNEISYEGATSGLFTSLRMKKPRPDR